MWAHRPGRLNLILNLIGRRRGGAVFLFRCSVLTLSLFIAGPAILSARGQQGDVLTRADELIAEKRYNDALNLLVPYARETPRDFDAAQKRIRQILFAKDTYNAIAKDVLDELEKPEPDPQRIVELTDKMIEVDPQRRDETMEFINKTRSVALFRANQGRLERILNEGKALVEKGSYTEALRTYSTGLPIYQAEFFSGPYGATMQNRVRQNINNINANIGAVASAANALEEAVNALAALSGQGIEPQNLTVYRNAYTRLSTEMDRFTSLRNTFADADAAFREDLIQLRKNFPQEGDRNFLAFATRLMEGRPENTDGILRAFDTIWNKAIPRARDLLDQKSIAVFAASVNDAGQQEYGKLGTRSETIREYGSFPVDLVIRWGRYDRGQKVTLFNQAVPAGEAGNFLKFRAFAESSPQWRTLGQLGARYLVAPNQDTVVLWRSGRNGDELIRTEQSTIATLRQIRTDAQTLLSTIQRDGTEYRNQETRYPNSGSLAYINGISQATNDLINLINISEETSSNRRFIIANGLMETRVGAREDEFKQGSDFFQGTQRGNYLAKYPTRAADILTRMDGALDADRQAVQNLMNLYNAEPAETAGSQQIRSLREEAAAIQTRLERTRSQGRNMATMARSQSADAERLRREGDRLFSEAQSALSRNDFDTAQNRIERSATAYDQSLEREDDEATWNKRNMAVPNLDSAIAEALNRDVLRQVAELINQIQNSYYGGEFDQAERLLTRAQNTWKKTQSMDNPDLVYWAGMIQLGIRSGTTIPRTAPLYAEMSQLLSDARKNYENGRVQITSSPTEARRKLNNAKANIEKIKLVYPMNKDAGILDLLIDQVLDPNFTATLNTRIDNAIARTRSGARSAQIQAVNDLRIYADVFPKFTNWEPIIRRAEEDAGLRLPPPTAQAIAEAQQIVDRAGPIIASGNIDRIREIQGELSRAMTLDPGNQKARELFTQSVTRIQRGTTVLDFEADRLFLQASQAITQNNPIRARQLLGEIYGRNPNYRYIDKVVTLQRRVDSML